VCAARRSRRQLGRGEGGDCGRGRGLRRPSRGRSVQRHGHGRPPQEGLGPGSQGAVQMGLDGKAAHSYGLQTPENTKCVGERQRGREGARR
jgi:hypothetical protein